VTVEEESPVVANERITHYGTAVVQAGHGPAPGGRGERAGAQRRHLRDDRRGGSRLAPRLARGGDTVILTENASNDSKNTVKIPKHCQPMAQPMVECE
jgi:hypothetical protein